MRPGVDPSLLEHVTDHQPFLLHMASALAEAAGGPDWRTLTTSTWSYLKGVPVGVGVRLPRTPAVFERKCKWRTLDDTPFETDGTN